MDNIENCFTENDYCVILHTENETMVVNVSRKLHPLEIGQAISGLLLLLEPDERHSVSDIALDNVKTNLSYEKSMM